MKVRSYLKSYKEILAWRNIYLELGDEPCPACNGAGVRTYGSTCTWHGGVGGQTMTSDICNRCWGSGNSNKPWLNLRRLTSADIKRLSNVKKKPL